VEDVESKMNKLADVKVSARLIIDLINGIGSYAANNNQRDLEPSSIK